MTVVRSSSQSGYRVWPACLAILLSTAYGYFQRYESAPWVQAAWAATFFNAWFMVVTDDPMVWFYYNWGVTCLPVFASLWVVNAFLPAPVRNPAAACV